MIGICLVTKLCLVMPAPQALLADSDAEDEVGRSIKASESRHPLLSLDKQSLSDRRYQAELGNEEDEDASEEVRRRLSTEADTTQERTRTQWAAVDTRF
jgi:hypothetical protein